MAVLWLRLCLILSHIPSLKLAAPALLRKWLPFRLGWKWNCVVPEPTIYRSSSRPLKLLKRKEAQEEVAPSVTSSPDTTGSAVLKAGY